jgi:hypothetical protein
MLSTVPGRTSFTEALKVAENLTTLRSRLLQRLLEGSTSVKVNRLALYIAQYHQHEWSNKFNEEKINLGSGKRVVQDNGRLDATYNITVPYSDEGFV